MKKALFGFATIVGLLFTGSLAAQSIQPTADAYSWNAELVGLDENARIVTVKAPITSDRVGTDFAPFKAGERIVLRWSGFEKYADSIAQAKRSTEAAKGDERFTFLVDFVSFDATRRYVTFKVQIPADSIANLKSLKPGEWVTATSPQGSLSKTTPIVTIRPYVITASTTTSG